MADDYTPIGEYPALDWKYGEDGTSMRAVTDLGPYINSMLDGLAGRVDELLAAGIIPMLETRGHLAAHDAEVLNGAADAIQALHPGEVKASVEFLRERATKIAEGGKP